MRISDWSSDVCSSDLKRLAKRGDERGEGKRRADLFGRDHPGRRQVRHQPASSRERASAAATVAVRRACSAPSAISTRSEEHTSELQSLMRISYAVFCLKKKQIT